MGAYSLEISNLEKQYSDFSLRDVSFRVPQGSIVGFIGENGAGKSTTISTVLGLKKVQSGSISLFGKQGREIDSEVLEQVGIVFDGPNFPESLTPKSLKNLLRPLYRNWDDGRYAELLQKLSLPEHKKIRHFSKGMKVKLSIAVALSHHAKLLILDEPTSGLDPVVRDDILDLFLDFVQQEDHSILVSSHITSDLEKVADYIVFLHAGRVIFEKPKDELLYQFGIVKCGAKLFEELDPAWVVAYRKQDYEYQALVKDRSCVEKKYPNAVVDAATIDEIMLMYIKGVTK